MCCSEPVSSLPSFSGDGVPAHTFLAKERHSAKGRHRADKLPRAEKRVAALQYPVSCLPLLAPGGAWVLREGLVFLTPTLLAVPQLWRDPSREIAGCTLLSGGLFWHQGPGAKSGISAITFISHWLGCKILPTPKVCLGKLRWNRTCFCGVNSGRHHR